MKPTYQSKISALFAGAIALSTAACDTFAPSISGRHINGPIAAPSGPIGSRGSPTGSDSDHIAQQPWRRPNSSGH